jgi:hypothetical protein
MQEDLRTLRIRMTVIMKSLQDVIRQKEHELQQALEDAVRAKELELMRLRKTLQEALTTIDRLLEEGADPVGLGQAGIARSFTPARDSERAPRAGGNNGGSDLP